MEHLGYFQKLCVGFLMFKEILVTSDLSKLFKQTLSVSLVKKKM